MDINQHCVVALTWTLKDSLGEVLDVLDEPVEFLLGGHDLLPAIEQALQGYAPGASLSLSLEPEQAFGDYDAQRVFLESRACFPEVLEVGMHFEGLPAGCSAQAPENLLYTVTDIYPEHVVLDGNHPLAGMSLRLQLAVHGVREASEQEQARGSMGVGFFQPLPVEP